MFTVARFGEVALVTLAVLHASGFISPRDFCYRIISRVLQGVVLPGSTSTSDAESLSEYPKLRRKLPADVQPQFQVGQVVRDKIRTLRGIIVGWDVSCSASEAWRVRHSAFAQWNKSFHYTLAVHDVDALSCEDENCTWSVYAPEPVLESIEGALIYGAGIPHFFAFYDSKLKRYIPQSWLLRMYPEDVHSHYHYSKELPRRTPAGEPLLRVVSFPVPGRLVAFGDEEIVGLAPGHFLVADPNMQQEPFAKAVLLMLRHDANFTQAVIVNRPFNKQQRAQQLNELTSMEVWLQNQTRIGGRHELGNLLSELSALTALGRRPSTDARLGGDVGVFNSQPPLPDYMSILHPFGEVPGAVLLLSGTGESEIPDLFLNGDLQAIRVAADKDKHAKVLMFRGYAGWGPQQLAGEIQHRDSWGLAAASVSDILWLEDKKNLWARVRTSAVYGEQIAFSGQ